MTSTIILVRGACPPPVTARCGARCRAGSLFGELDRNIPAAAHRIMADRAGAKRTIEIARASHVVGVSHPGETAQLILEAAAAHAEAGDGAVGS